MLTNADPVTHHFRFLCAMPKKSPEDLRSFRWFGPDTQRGATHRQRFHQLGYRREDFIGKPVIGILNTWNDINTCHGHFPERVKSIRRGVSQAGGLPLELPAISLAEVMQKPTTMLYRNLLAMEAEELIRSYPVDGVVLMGGCDKTTPGLIMGAISAGIPAIYFPAGPMLAGSYGGRSYGAGTDLRRTWDDRKAGILPEEEWLRLEREGLRAPGTCNTMGTASTMTSLMDAMGFILTGGSSIPAAFSGNMRLATSTGERAVEMVHEDLTPDRIATRKSYENAVITDMALAGSTNAAIHMIAIARRAGIDATLDDFRSAADKVRVIVNLKPSGEYLMQEFYDAGGLRAALNEIADLLHLDAMTVSGRTLGEEIGGASIVDADVIRARSNPIIDRPSLAVLNGNLAPDGAVLKVTAASERLLKHEGPALVFDSIDELHANINRDDLEVDENTVMVLRNCGPVGAPGMPEWGFMPLPRKLLKKGVRDLVRISDCRMSGTSYGTCVLHVAPEAAVGGPLALVRTGDTIRLDVDAGSLDLVVDDDELEARRAALSLPPRVYQRGYAALYVDHVLQANDGCDFDFLAGTAPTGEPKIF